MCFSWLFRIPSLPLPWFSLCPQPPPPTVCVRCKIALIPMRKICGQERVSIMPRGLLSRFVSAYPLHWSEWSMNMWCWRSPFLQNGIWLSWKKLTNKQTRLTHHMCGMIRLKRWRFGEGGGEGGCDKGCSLLGRRTRQPVFCILVACWT